MNGLEKNEGALEKENLHPKRKKKRNKKNILITSMPLFISLLDRIYLIMLALIFCVLNFIMFNCCYEIGKKIFWELLIFIVVFVGYLFFNWLYKCKCKSKLYLTKNKVCKSVYFPFFKKETSIPLNKITSVTTCNILWIFRSLGIHQCGRLPIVFFTWNNQEFKEVLDNLIASNDDIYNYSKKSNILVKKYQNKNIITEEVHGFLVLLGIIVVLVLAIGFPCCSLNKQSVVTEDDLVGVYCLDDDCWDSEIELYSSGYCNIGDMMDSRVSIHGCSWSYWDDDEVYIKYNYIESVPSVYSDTGIRIVDSGDSSLTLYYDVDSDTLETDDYPSDIYVRQ